MVFPFDDSEIKRAAIGLQPGDEAPIRTHPW
jgi:hypothetical protein